MIIKKSWHQDASLKHFKSNHVITACEESFWFNKLNASNANYFSFDKNKSKRPENRNSQKR